MAAVLGTVATPFVQTNVTSFSQSMATGTAAADRITFAVISIEHSATFALTAFTLDGNAPLGTVEASHGTTFRKVIIGWWLTTSGTASTVAGSFSGVAAGDMVLNAISVTGIGTAPTTSDTLTGQGTGTVASGVIDAVLDGFVLGGVFFNNTGTVTWSGLTERTDSQSASSGMRGSTATLIPTANEANRAVSSTGSGAAADWVIAGVSFAPAGAGAITGTLTATLGPLTASSAATVAINASLASTLGGLGLSAASRLAIQAAANPTLGTLTLSAAGAAVTPVTGSLAVTLGQLTSLSASRLQVRANLARTLGSLTLSSAARVLPAITGSLTATLGPLTLEASNVSQNRPNPVGGAGKKKSTARDDIERIYADKRKAREEAAIAVTMPVLELPIEPNGPIVRNEDDIELLLLLSA